MASTITEFAHLKIPLEDVVAATKNFHDDNIIGHGGFGSIYKGELLRSGELIKIAALRLDRRQREGDLEFLTQISVQSALKHTNLVSIIGFCDEKHEKIVVTTRAAQGSLQEHIHDPSLTWTQRLKICVGVARALSYLHYDERRGYGVIHLNINSSTILLDENREAKLSGFKVSIKQSLNRMDQVILSNPFGTIGYVDPEIGKIKGVTQKSDIYAFGVVLFELLCGRRAYIKNDANMFLSQLAKYHYENQTLEDIIHPDLRNQMSLGSLRKYSRMAYSCLNEERAQRPHINNIVDELEKALKFQQRHEHFGKNLEHLKIPLDDLKLATNNFSETYKIDSIDSCTWYTAELGHSDKENPSSVEGKSKGKLSKRHDIVDIKCFLPKDDEHGEVLFFTELEVLTSVKHHNIVTLIGFCVEGFKMILVIENFPNGSLWDYLGNVERMRNLTWEKRLKISIDVARALYYLHYEMEEKKMIIHTSITGATFGLDENLEMKIKNFEWAVLLPSNQLNEALCKRTLFESKYHVDPEFVKTAKLKRESDVYSFGVVLLEIFCGRHTHDQIYLKESAKGLVHVARRNFYTGTLEEMIDPTLKEETFKKSSISNKGVSKNSLHTFLKVANQCLAETHDQRVTIKFLLNELEKALAFQVSQEEGVQQADKDKADESEKAKHEIPEEGVQRPNTERASYLQLRNEIIVKNLEHLRIPLSNIKLATNDFSYAYQMESFGEDTLYRAELEYYDKENHSSKRRSIVVIKRYPFQHSIYGEKEFLTELKILSSVKHPNIVTLLGFCVEGYEMILVTDNFSYGSLAHCFGDVNDKRFLTWERRLKICIDVARALKYIHYEMEDQKVIINRDICSRSIGLDEKQGAKIVHFWSSVLLPPNQEDEAIFVDWTGRPAYIDPAYQMTSKLKRESDVYSFGVVLLEILCGRTAYNPIYKNKNGQGLAMLARRNYRNRTLGDMIDPTIKEGIGENNFVLNIGPTKESLNTFIEIAHQCLAEVQDQRPTMKVVVKELEKALFLQNHNKDNPRISLEDINQATKNFHKDNCIGIGGFGTVYVGDLQDGKGCKTIVAKRLDTRSGQGEQEFLSELQILLEYKHENVIGLVGYCDENNEKIIVYEYLPKGSLDRYLNDASLTWVKRLNICIDVARALDFLHGGAGKQARVIHRDIKTSNILLKWDWKAVLADFGLSLISPLTQQRDYVIDHACGTMGYVDPLYRKLGFLTIESDIYSFGVVLFEILCGRTTFAIKPHEGNDLSDFIRNKSEEKKLDEVIFEPIREQIMPKSLITFQEIAYRCLHHEREKRPSTKKVLLELHKALEFQNMASTITKFAHLQIPIEDVVRATNNFHEDNIIQDGEFGTTYKGVLLRSGSTINIAARRFDCKHREVDLKFLTEISVLTELKHTNLVSIIGFCDEKNTKIIITTYEANRSLKYHLDNMNLTWTLRLRICIGVARALSYLHYYEGRGYTIIHCNINSDTILLDENYEAKISGFEFSIKQSEYDKDQACLCEHITMGCIDPTIEMMGGVTYKSDVYSFGVILFEILCGRKAFIQNDANEFLAPLAKYHYENGTLQDIVHPGLWNQLSTKSLFEFSRAAYACLKEERLDRPNTNTLVDTLEKALESQLSNGKNLEHLKISLSDIKSATDDFSKTYVILITYGCTLYRAELDHFDKEDPSSKERNDKEKHPKGRITVVIKRYTSGHELYNEDAFFSEIEMLADVEHHNIVSLLGFCVEESELILVTENVSNGYLGQYLGKDTLRILTWEKRLKICIDVAHALKYLHFDREKQTMIIHHDINSMAIALDENLGAKLVDFWWSVKLPPNQDEVYHVNWIGKPSYLDPEYKKTGNLKRESDVYCFGVVLLEMLCGRTSYDPIYNNDRANGLANLVRRSFSTGTLGDMIDPIIMEESGENIVALNKGPNKDSLYTFIEIAHQCVAETQDQRPTMKVVVKELEKAFLFQVDASASQKQKQGIHS